MKRPATLKQLIDFVLKYRKGNAFKGYSEETIASAIWRASKEGTMLYSTSEVTGEPCGIVVAFTDDKNHIVYVNDILTTERWVLPAFYRIFTLRYPDYELYALRCGKQVCYNTTRLYRLLLKGEPC